MTQKSIYCKHFLYENFITTIILYQCQLYRNVDVLIWGMNMVYHHGTIITKERFLSMVEGQIGMVSANQKNILHM